jgi:hypothetical protein
MTTALNELDPIVEEAGHGDKKEQEVCGAMQ